MTYEDPREREKRSTNKCICKQGGLDFCLYPAFHYPGPLSSDQQKSREGEIEAFERVLHWAEVQNKSFDEIKEYIRSSLSWMVSEVELAKKYDHYMAFRDTFKDTKYQVYVPLFKEKGWKL